MTPAAKPKRSQCVLRRIAPFSHVSADTWERFHELRTMHTYHKGNVIFYDGNPSLGMHFLCTGRVKIVKSDTGKRFHIARVVKAPDLLGDRSFIAQEPYMGSAEAMEESTVYFLEARHFKELFLKDPYLGYALARRFAKELGQAEEKMLDLALKTIRERLAKYLLEHLSPHHAGKPARVAISESRAELSEILGTTPEAVSRGLAEFRNRGWIAVENHAVLVLNEERLRQVAHLSV